jgi:hemerythrin
MPLVAWSQKYSVNIRDIDEQHKALIGMINDLHDALKKGEGRRAASEILQKMIEYAAMHFSFEEKYMLRYDYPDFPSHKERHMSFVEQVLGFQRDLDEGRAAVPLEVMKFLMEWLLEHIKQVDMKYGPFLNDRGVR